MIILNDSYNKTSNIEPHENSQIDCSILENNCFRKNIQIFPRLKSGDNAIMRQMLSLSIVASNVKKSAFWFLYLSKATRAKMFGVSLHFKVLLDGSNKFKISQIPVRSKCAFLVVCSCCSIGKSNCRHNQEKCVQVLCDFLNEFQFDTVERLFSLLIRITW